MIISSSLKRAPGLHVSGLPFLIQNKKCKRDEGILYCQLMQKEDEILNESDTELKTVLSDWAVLTASRQCMFTRRRGASECLW